MAKIGDKNLKDFSSWDLKEVRKLIIMLQNRIATLEVNPDKKVAKSHVLFGQELGACKELLVRANKAKKLMLRSEA